MSFCSASVLIVISWILSCRVLQTTRSEDQVTMGGDHVPPFLVGDEAVLIMIYVLEELMQPARRDGDSGAFESRIELLLVELSVLVPIYGPEEPEELPLGGLDEDAEFCGD